MSNTIRLTDNILRRISRLPELQERFDTFKAIANLDERRTAGCGGCGSVRPNKRRMNILLLAAKTEIVNAPAQDLSALKKYTGGSKLVVYYRRMQDGKNTTARAEL
jgi:ubiquitin C-terminal hydrolase